MTDQLSVGRDQIQSGAIREGIRTLEPLLEQAKKQKDLGQLDALRSVAQMANQRALDRGSMKAAKNFLYAIEQNINFLERSQGVSGTSSSAMAAYAAALKPDSKRPSRMKAFLIYGGAIAAVIVFFAVISGGNSKAKKTASDAKTPATVPAATTTKKPADPPGDNMNYRTRIFIKQLRSCQTGVELLTQVLNAAAQVASPDLVSLSSNTSSVHDLCDSVRHRMALMDTNHFHDQALDTEIAVDDYKSGLNDLSDYIDTQTPSKIVNAGNHFNDANSEASQALQEINDRRAVYNLPPLR